MTTRFTSAVAIATTCAVALAALGLLFSRGDVVALGAPLALWAVWTTVTAKQPETPEILIDAPLHEDGRYRSSIEVRSDAEAVHLVALLGHSLERQLVVAPDERLEAFSIAQHSGPWFPVWAHARAISADGATTSARDGEARSRHAIAPSTRHLDALPTARTLSGLHGSHQGWRPGQGGDFRDIHPWAPGDELRRVDWKATARLARRRGDLQVRRMHTMSEQAIALVVDGIDDLGEVVATWDRDAPQGSGVTSLDLAREAARSLATMAIETGDRVSLHELGVGGRMTRSAAGNRHLARLAAAITTLAPRESARHWARTPPVPRGSVVFLLSTFLDDTAADLATGWLGAGHRVVAIDTLPHLDPVRLNRAERTGLRLVLAERRERIVRIERQGADLVVWADDPGIAMRLLVRRPR
ncbi:MAG: DUF58 domain-containing protein [Microbacterium sp.]